MGYLTIYLHGVYDERRKRGIRMEEKPESKEKSACPHCVRVKLREPKEYKRLIHRLNRIEGQIRGIRGMVEKSAYCPDILVQSAAAAAAIQAFNRELLENHIRSCVAEDLREGKAAAADELVKLLAKFMK